MDGNANLNSAKNFLVPKFVLFKELLYYISSSLEIRKKDSKLLVILKISVLNEWCWVNIIPFWVLWELPESRELKLPNSSPPLFLHKKDKCSSFECKLWIATLNGPSPQSLYGLHWNCGLPNPNFVLKIKPGTLFW